MIAKDAFLLSVLHGIMEFLPISSSFFINKLFSNDFSLLLHGICGIFTFFYFLPNVKLLFNLKFIGFSIMFVMFFAIHFLLAESIWFLPIAFLLFLSTKLSKHIFNKFSICFIVYVLLISVMHLITLTPEIEILTHFIFMVLMLLSLIFNNEENEMSFNIIDAFLLAGLVFISSKFCISRLGIMITYFSFKRTKLADSIQYSFIFSGIINCLCLLAFFIKMYYGLPFDISNSEIPNQSEIIWITAGSCLALPISFTTIHFFNKYPMVMIICSTILRLILLIC